EVARVHDLQQCVGDRPRRERDQLPRGELALGGGEADLLDGRPAGQRDAGVTIEGAGDGADVREVDQGVDAARGALGDSDLGFEGAGRARGGPGCRGRGASGGGAGPRGAAPALAGLGLPDGAGLAVIDVVAGGAAEGLEVPQAGASAAMQLSAAPAIAGRAIRGDAVIASGSFCTRAAPRAV